MVSSGTYTHSNFLFLSFSYFKSVTFFGKRTETSRYCRNAMMLAHTLCRCECLTVLVAIPYCFVESEEGAKSMRKDKIVKR